MLFFKGGSLGARLLVEQLRDFPCGDHDDGPDALEMAVRLAEGMFAEARYNEPPTYEVWTTPDLSLGGKATGKYKQGRQSPHGRQAAVRCDDSTYRVAAVMYLSSASRN